MLPRVLLFFCSEKGGRRSLIESKKVLKARLQPNGVKTTHFWRLPMEFQPNCRCYESGRGKTRDFRVKSAGKSIGKTLAVQRSGKDEAKNAKKSPTPRQTPWKCFPTNTQAALGGKCPAAPNPKNSKQKLRKNQDSVLFFFHFSSFNEIRFFFSSKSLSTALFCLHLKYSLKHSRRRMKNLPNPWKNFVTRRAQIFQIEIFIFHKKSFFSEIFARFPDFLSFSTNFHKNFPNNSRKSLIFFHKFPIWRFFLTLQLIFFLFNVLLRAQRTIWVQGPSLDD